MTAPRLLSRAEVRAVYDRIGAWQDTQAFYEKPALDALIAHGASGDAQSILEVGCGTGRLAERILETCCPSEGRYLGVDLSSRMVEIARDRLLNHENRAEVVQTDGRFSFDHPDGTQDRIVAAYLLDLLPEDDIRSFLSESHRLLRGDGRLCLAGLTRGECLFGQVASTLWTALHAAHPEWVGGCRPLRMRRFVEAGPWTIVHREVVRHWGVPSEVLISKPGSTE